jgi:hypothetical protein
MFHLLFLIKLAVAVIVVVGLSLLTEHVSPRVAGILSGYPTGSAILLFFYGLEKGPEFAAESAVYTMLGITASISFIYFYYRASKKFQRYNILWSSLVAISGFLIVIGLLHFVQFNKFIDILIPIIFSFLFIHLFNEIENTRISEKVNLSYRIIFIRAFFAGLIIVLISSAPNFFGPAWAGLFSAFPTTLFPLILIIHYTYDKKHVHTIIKNVPVGMFSLIIYTLSVSIVYPLYGIYWGTLFSYLLASIYLVVYQQIRKQLLIKLSNQKSQH